MRLVVAASMPWDSAHSGTIDCRVARAAEMTSTPTPRVSSTRRCSARTASTDRCWRPAAAADRRSCLVTSGRKAVEHRRRQRDQRGEPVRRPDSPGRDDRRRGERSEEQPDPEGAAQGRQRAGAHRDGHRLGQVGLAGQAEHRAGQPGDQDGHREQSAATGPGTPHRGRARRPRRRRPAPAAPRSARPARRRAGRRAAGRCRSARPRRRRRPTLAPRSRAESAISGRIAPWPIETSTVGPYAGMAMSRHRTGVAMPSPLLHGR